MKKVVWSINGQYFADFGVFVAGSSGFGMLKRKTVQKYDWAEYHGESVDLRKPKYEAREITLNCFIIDESWEDLYANFKRFEDEFMKSGTQRFLIQPFGKRPMPYEIYLAEGIELEKRFKDEKMAAVFNLKMIEPNPIKKILYTTAETLNLSYNSNSETEIFYGNGTKDIANGNVSIGGKILPNRNVSRYAFEGRNFLPGTSNGAGWRFPNDGKGSNINSGVFTLYDNYYNQFSSPNIYGVGGEVFTLSWDGADVPNVNYDVQVRSLDGEFDKRFKPNNFGLNVHTFTLGWAMYFNINIFGTVQGGGNLRIKNLKLEKGNNATPYSVAPEDEKYIIIAGNIEEISNLQTNADILWERL